MSMMADGTPSHLTKPGGWLTYAHPKWRLSPRRSQCAVWRRAGASLSPLLTVCSVATSRSILDPTPVAAGIGI